MTDWSTTEETIIDELRAIAEETGQVPTAADIEEHASFSHRDVKQVFGGLALAQLAAGFEPTTIRGLPDKLLLNELQIFAEDLGRSPSRSEFETHSLLPRGGYRARWGSWKGTSHGRARTDSRTRTGRHSRGGRRSHSRSG